MSIHIQIMRMTAFIHRRELDSEINKPMKGYETVYEDYRSSFAGER